MTPSISPNLKVARIAKGDIVRCFECGTPLRAFTACPKCNPPVPEVRP